MKLAIKQDEGTVEIEKQMNKLLKSYNKKCYLIKCSCYIFIIGNGIFNHYVKISVFLFLLFSPLLDYFFKYIFDVIRYVYSNEIIKIEENKIITLKYILEGVILYRKNINIEEIEKMYIVESKKSYNIFRRSKKSKVLYPFIEDRRRVKIKLLNGETYSWGVNLDNEEIEKVKTYLKDYLQENQLEYLLEFKEKG